MFSFQIDPRDLLPVILPALALAVVTALGKVATGWWAAGRAGVGRRGRMRAGTMLIARGEFAIVVAAIGASLTEGPELAALAAAYVLLTDAIGPISTKFADRLVRA